MATSFRHAFGAMTRRAYGPRPAGAGRPFSRMGQWLYRTAALRVAASLLIVLSSLPLSLMLPPGLPFAPDTAYAVSFAVNSATDGADFSAGDGVCETASGNGVCTLRAALEESAAASGSDTIALPAGTYTLTLGELHMSATANITGAGAAATIIDGANASRVLKISAGSGVISGVTIRNGADTSGGGGVRVVFTAGQTTNPTIQDSILDNNASGGASGNGGGIYVEGSTSLTLTGVALTGNGATAWGGGIWNAGTLTVTGSTLSGNNSGFVVTGRGGGIYNTGTLTVTNSTLSGNVSSGTGGGIYNSSGTLTVTGSTLSGNSAADVGGGIANLSGTLTLANSTVSGNASSTVGGGLYTQGANPVAITNATFSGNSAATQGGGINIAAGGGVTLKNTIVANGTGGDCSGALTSQGNNLIEDTTNCTISGDTTGNITGQDPLLSALADNGGPTQTHALLPGSPAIDAGDNTACAAAPVNGVDQRGTVRPQPAGGVCDIGAFELVLSSNADLSGLTLSVGTLAPAFASGTLAYDAGTVGDSSVTVTPTAADAGATIQVRAYPGGTPSGSYVSVASGAASSALALTVGANTVEVKVTAQDTATTQTYTITITRGAPTGFVVNSAADAVDAMVGDGGCEIVSGNGVCTLRAAIQEANALAGAQTITFATALNGTPITLTITGASEDAAATGDLDITSEVTITGNGPTNTIIQGCDVGADPNCTGTDRVFQVLSGGSADIVSVTVRKGSSSAGGGLYNAGTLKVGTSVITGNTSGGISTSGGGGIANAGTLLVDESTISGNTTTPGPVGGANGGGIWNAGTATVGSSTLSNNTSADVGGGIANIDGTLTVANSTISGNTSPSVGGGLYNQAPATVTNVTFSGNSASVQGGGINAAAGHTVTARNSIFANSTGGDCSGLLTSQGHNLIESTTNCTITGTTAGNITGQDPVLGPLASNGGPTQTHALLAGSPAIDGGDAPVGVAAVDQRGIARPQGAAWDIGAFELEIVTFTLTVSTTGAGSGTVTSNPAGILCGAACSASFDSGTPVTLTGTPDAGSTFAGWTGACTGAGSCTVTMDAARSVTATFTPVSPPPFEREFPLPSVEGMCICTPLFMNTDTSATEAVWVKLNSAAPTIRVIAHAVNTIDPETVTANVYDAGGALIATATVSYSAAEAAAAGAGFEKSVDIVLSARTVGEVLRVDITTPATPGTQPHWRLKLFGAGAAAITSPSFPSLEEGPVRWLVNVNAGEPLDLDLFTTGVPGPGASSVTYRLLDPAGAPLAPVTVAVGAGAEISLPTPAAGLWTVEIVSIDGHYRLDKTTGADRSLYISWITSGGANTQITGNLTLGGAPNTIPVTVTVTDTRSGAVVKSLTGVTGSYVADKLLPGVYEVQVSGPAGVLVTPSVRTVTLTCDQPQTADFALTPPGFTVNSTADAVDAVPGDSVCETAAGNGVCTLRAAIREANALAGAQTITFATALNGTPITLTITGAGEDAAATGDLDLTGAVTITGNGAANTIIAMGGGVFDRVLHILPGVSATVSGVTIQSGQAVSAFGGGIYNRGSLTLSNSTITGNWAGLGGGGIRNENSLYVSNSTISHNSSPASCSPVGYGGGIYSSGVLSLANSTVYSNTSCNGGGIAHSVGTTTISNSTISGNTASTSGGGIDLRTSGTVTISSSTISGNSAAGNGGGIRANNAVATLRGVIVANNTASSAANCSNVVSAGYNLSSDASCTTFTAVGDQQNTNPLLGPLTDNGGPTQTHALLPGSPAINAIPTASCTDASSVPVTADQRGTARPQSVACDIGAFELVVGSPAQLAFTAITPASPVAGQSFSVAVQSQDASSIAAVVSQDTGVSLSLMTGAGTLGGTLTGTIPAGQYSVTISGVTYSKVETGVVLTATRTSGDTLTAGDSAAFTVVGALLQFSAAAFPAKENGGSATITVTRTRGSLGAVSVAYATSDGTATAGADYTAASGTLSWADGDSAAQTFTVSITDDAVHEGNEMVNLTLSSPTGGASLGSQSTAVLTIFEEVFVVNSAADAVDAAPGDGVCETATGVGVCTLRAAIREANALAGAQTIILPAGTYTRTIAPAGSNGVESGDLNITGDLTITGAGAAGTVINGAAQDRVFNVASAVTLNISGVTISGGRIDSGGGGIYNNGGTVTLSNSTVSGNVSTLGNGGGISNGGTLTINNSTVRGNTAGGSGPNPDGGGIFNAGTLTLSNSTISGNTAWGRGGGLRNIGTPDFFTFNATMRITNSTISGNSSVGGGGGGIYNAGTLDLSSSTLSGNSGPNYGGIFNNAGTNGGTARLASVIVANNSGADCVGTMTSLGHNLIESTTNCFIAGVTTGNIIGQDPRLGPLTDNGGPTQTHALLPGSPAINAGDNAACAAAPVSGVDQRGALRPQAGTCDIGAVEFVPPAYRTTVDAGTVPAAWEFGETKLVTVTATNTGSQSWNATGFNPVVLMAQFAASAGGSPITQQVFPLPDHVAPGSAHTFTNIPITAPLGAAGVLEFAMVRQGAGGFPAQATVNVTVDAPHGTIDTTNAPDLWVQTRTQTFTTGVTNTGTGMWPAAGSAAVVLRVRFSGGPDRLFPLPGNVAPGAPATVSVSIAAPATSGATSLEFALIKQGAGAVFGQTSKAVTVSTALAGTVATTNVPPTWALNKVETFNVPVQNTGGATWTTTGPDRVTLRGKIGSQPFVFANLPGVVAPNGPAVVSISLTAPSTTGPASVELALVHAGSGMAFGTQTVNVTVGTSFQGTVDTAGVPVEFTAGKPRSFSVSVSNTAPSGGGATWTISGATRVLVRTKLGSQPFQYFNLPGSVAPGGNATVNAGVTAGPVAAGVTLEVALVQAGQTTPFATQNVTADVVPAQRGSIDASGLPGQWTRGRPLVGGLVQVTNTAPVGGMTWTTTGSAKVLLRASVAGGSYQYFGLPGSVAPGGSASVPVFNLAPVYTTGPASVEFALLVAGQAPFATASLSITVKNALEGSFDVSAVPTAFTAGKAKTFSVTVNNTAAPDGNVWQVSGAGKVVLRARFGGASPLPYQYVGLAAPLSPGDDPATLVVTLTAPATLGEAPVELALLLAGAPSPFATANVTAQVVARLQGSTSTAGVPGIWQRGQKRTFTVPVANTALGDGATWTTSGTGRILVRARIGTQPYVYVDLAGAVAPGASGVSLNITLAAPNLNGSYPVELALLPAGANSAFGTASVNVQVRDGMVASISSAGIPTVWNAGESKTFNVNVNNMGAATWNATGANPVVLVAKFVNATSGAQLLTPAIVALATDVAPNGTAVLSVTLAAPASLSDVALDFQMVKQGVTTIPANLRTPVTAAP